MINPTAQISKGLSGSSLEDDQRTISLDRLLHVTDFSLLCHINKLELCGNPLLNCIIPDTHGLRNIARLSLLSCWELERLVGIEDIPEIVLANCGQLNKWEELRDHEVVKVGDQRMFQDMKDRQQEMNIKTLIGYDSNGRLSLMRKDRGLSGR